MGGFIKANARYVEGNLKFQDSWTGGQVEVLSRITLNVLNSVRKKVA